MAGLIGAPSSPHLAERVIPVRAPKSRRTAGSAGSSSTGRPRRCCHRCGRSASETTSPPGSTGPSREARATTTPAQYPIGWIHRHRQRLPAGGVGLSAEAKSYRLRLAARNARPCGVRPEPCRDVAATARSPPTLPDRRHQVPSARRTCRLGFASQHESLRTMHPGNPEGSPWRPQPRVFPLRTSNTGVDSRRSERVATFVAEQHESARRRNRARPGHGSCGPKPALSDHQLGSAAST
jgi:hypothetical protein